MPKLRAKKRGHHRSGDRGLPGPQPLEHRSTMDVAAFRFVPKTRSKLGAAGSIWRGAATKRMRGDFYKKIAADDRTSAAAW